jgi:hypothetical protein
VGLQIFQVTGSAELVDLTVSSLKSGVPLDLDGCNGTMGDLTQPPILLFRIQTFSQSGGK